MTGGEPTDARAACIGVLEAILKRFETSDLSAPIALMELLIAAEDAALVREVVLARAALSPRAGEIARLLEENTEGCARVAAMLQSDMDRPPRGGSVEEGVAFCRRLFDWSVRQSEEASVALYSLGNPKLLDAATDEIVALFETWGFLDRRIRALDVGCGIGRLATALAPRVRELHAIDLSPSMIAAAERRCAGLENVTLAVCSGLDLGEIGDGRFDLVFAIDSFPYLVQSGRALVEKHFAEAARVLGAGGELVILNFSYRDDLAADRRDIDALARANGFDVVLNGTTPFALWNGAAFRMQLRR